MTEKKGFFGRLFGRDKEEHRDKPDENGKRPKDDKEHAAATASEDAEAGADAPLHEELKKPAAEAPAQLEDEANIAPNANEDGYLEVEEEQSMPVADTGPAKPDIEARALNDVPIDETQGDPAPQVEARSPAEPSHIVEEQTGIGAVIDPPEPESTGPEEPAEAEDTLDTAPDAPVADIPEPDSAPAPAAVPEEVPEKKKGFFARLRDGLSKSSDKLSGGVSAIFTKRKLDDETLEELEDLLISADLGLPATTRIISALSEGRYEKEISSEEVRRVLADEVAKTLKPLERPLQIDPSNRPHIILMTGVNGAGKTTTIGKLAKKFADDGKSVMLAAGDTFRAAAIEQLEVWGERTGAPVITRPVGSDAAGLAYDAVKEAQEKDIDVLMIDTAGRLQNRRELMDELAKIIRVIKKLDETAPHDAVLILDATVGQNALSQAEAFTQTAGITGLVMTKLDGTARGGVLVALADKFVTPIHYIGVGESVEDLQAFDADTFSRALSGLADA